MLAKSGVVVEHDVLPKLNDVFDEEAHGKVGLCPRLDLVIMQGLCWDTALPILPLPPHLLLTGSERRGHQTCS